MSTLADSQRRHQKSDGLPILQKSVMVDANKIGTYEYHKRAKTYQVAGNSESWLEARKRQARCHKSRQAGWVTELKRILKSSSNQITWTAVHKVSPT